MGWRRRSASELEISEKRRLMGATRCTGRVPRIDIFTVMTARIESRDKICQSAARVVEERCTAARVVE